MKLNPIREFALKALLWLPFAFFLWFAFRSPLVWVPVHLSAYVLQTSWPALIADVVQHGHLMETTTRILVNQAAADGRSGLGELVLTQNPLVYGYSLPLFAGLAMATPLSGRRRLLQLVVGIFVIWLAQAFGVVSESLKQLAYEAGDAGAQAVAKEGISATAIALAYQFGYLILPAVVPVALWLGLNRGFIQTLVHPDARAAAR